MGARVSRVVLLGVLAAACGDDGAPPPGADAGVPGCNPVVGADCVTPFPSTFHMAADSTTPTGLRVALRGDRLPISGTGVVLDPVRMNARDGFSPATPFLVAFDQRVDPAGLPDASPAGLALSVTATSPVQVIEYATGARVPVMAELDSNATEWDKQALILRPLVRLRPATRYVVALVGLRDPAGQPILPEPFRKLRDGLPLDGSLEPLAARYQEIFTALGQAGVARESLTLAWDVVTGSDEPVTGRLLHMRDVALAMADEGMLGTTIVSVEDTPGEPHRLREIQATVQVPSFLESDEGTAMMSFGPDGLPAVRALVDVAVTIEIPRCAETATGPLPFMVFGHGLFDDARRALGDALLLEVANELCMVVIGTDWIGLSAPDFANLAMVAADVNQLYFVTDRLQQAHINAHVMTRLFKLALKDDEALALGGQPVADGAEAYYLGVSNGGVQGGAFMAVTPDVVRGVLNVPGAVWNLMMYRSTHFNSLIPLLQASYVEALDRQILVALSQFEWDYTDPITFAPYLVADPLPGAPAKRVILQESIGDAQVPNLATRLLARTIGVDALPLSQPVYGVVELAGPLDSAYTQWDSHPSPLPPEYNQPPPEDNGAHGGIQAWPELREQVRRFFRPDGRAEDTCGGPCSF